MKFKNDRHRKAVMTNINKYGVTLKKSKGWSELPDPRTGKAPGHQLAALKAKARGFSNKHFIRPIITEESYIDKISKTTAKLTPIKVALKYAFPQAAPAIEVGYQFLTNLDTIRGRCNYIGTTRNDLKNVINETIEDAAKYVFNSSLKSIKENTISNLVEYSSNYLDEKQVFEALTEELKFDKSYSHAFKEFYQTSLKNVLNQEFDENVKSFR